MDLRPNFSSHFKYPQNGKKAATLFDLIGFHQSVSINKISTDESQKKGFYRLLKSNQNKEESYIDSISEVSTKNCKDKTLLVLQDTSEFNFNRCLNKHSSSKGFGLLSDNRSRGFKIHTSMAINIANDSIVGLPYLKVIAKRKGSKDRREREYRKLNIKQKESYKWIESANESKKRLLGSSRLIFVADREADIYEFLYLIPDEKTDFIIRLSQNRRLKDKMKISDKLNETAVAGYSLMPVEDNKRKKRKSRMAKMNIKYAPITIVKPKEKNANTGKHPKNVDLYIVEAKEDFASVPRGEEPIHWKIITSIETKNIVQAQKIIELYAKRWYVEQLFRIVKQQGLKVEKSELSSAWSLRKITLLAMSVAIQAQQLRQNFNRLDGEPIEILFNKKQIKCLELMNQKYEGKTEKQKNPNPPNKLAWATWIIGRMGGWKVYDKKRPPGVITLKRGLEDFYKIYNAWEFLKKVS